MSDGEDDTPDRQLVKNPVVFGSLEAKERERIAESSARQSGDVTGLKGPSSAVEEGVAAGNINYAPADAELLELAEPSQEMMEKRDKMMQSFEVAKRARVLALPTTDHDVRTRLRALGHPVTLFGEGPGERRERLRAILSQLEQSGVDISEQINKIAKAEEEVSGAAPEQYPYYTEGLPHLKRLRYEVAQFSLNRARKRIMAAKDEARTIENLYRGQYTGHEEQRKEKIKTLRQYASNFSNLGDDRPLTSCRFSSSGHMVATTSWSESLCLWQMPAAATSVRLKGHKERVTSVDFHPFSGSTLSATAANVVSASADNTAKLWAANGRQSCLATLKGHTARLSQARFHPQGRLVATSSFDNSWRLWDLATGGQLVLTQEGSMYPTYGLAFHPDGSVIGVTGLDTFTRLWDTRSGKCVQVLEGHVKDVLAIDFSPNGHILATGSDDHSVKIWDMRRKKAIYSIAAHTHLVSSVRFEPTTGWFLATSSFDKTCKLFGTENWSLAKTLAGHASKVTSVDVLADGESIVSTSFDRTFKIWKRDVALNLDDLEEMKPEIKVEDVKMEPSKFEEDSIKPEDDWTMSEEYSKDGGGVSMEE